MQHHMIVEGAVETVSLPKVVRKVTCGSDAVIYAFCRLFNDRRSILLVKHDFTSQSAQDLHLIRVKTESLTEINALVHRLKSAEIPEAICAMLHQLFSRSICSQKPLNHNPKGPAYDPEEDELAFAADWEHLQLLYRIFFSCLENSCISSACFFLKFFGASFARRFFSLLKSEDLRERDCLMAIFHRYYRLFFGLRKELRKFICYFLHEALHETPYEYAGIEEVLKISVSIVSGFQTPLKSEHLVFFRRYLLPMHRSPVLRMFSEPLAALMDRFMMKDAALSVELMAYLLAHWPPKAHSKEGLLFVAQIDDAMRYAQHCTLSDDLRDALMSRIRLALRSGHFQMCERTLKLFHTPFVQEWSRRETRFFYAQLLPEIFAVSRDHWCQPIRFMANAVLTLYASNDFALFSRFLSEDLCRAAAREAPSKMDALLEKLRQKT